MKNTLKKVIILFIAVFIFLIGCIYLFFNVRKIDNTKLIINSGVSTKTELIANNNVKSDEIIKLSDDGKLDLALKKQLQIFKENKEKNLGDYQQLMWIYIDMGEYEKVISLGLKALVLYKEQGNNNLDIKHEIYGHIIQAYLYLGKLNDAEKYLKDIQNDKKSKYTRFIFEETILEYKKGNYDNVINSYEKIKKDTPVYIGGDLDLLAKSYIKNGDIKNAIRIYEEIFNFGNKFGNQDIYEDGVLLEKKNVIVSIIYLYISSSKLKDLYLKLGNNEKSDFYNLEFLKYKKKIDSEDIINGIKIDKKNIYFIINRFNDL